MIPPGAPAISDPVELSVAPLGSVVVSFFLPDVTPMTTFHWDAGQTTYVVAGNKIGETDFKADSTFTSRVLLSEILVDAPANARAIVTFGDSITDGDNSTPDTNHRWPDVLARRLVEAGGPPVAVLNEGISGRPHPDRSHGRQCARSLRSRRAASPARRHRDPDDGDQRYRLAGQHPRAERSERHRPRTSSPAISSSSLARTCTTCASSARP